MNGYKDKKAILLIILSCSLISAAVSAVFLSSVYQRMQFQMLGVVCGSILEEHPDTTQSVLLAVKEYKRNPAVRQEKNILLSFGYRQSDFLPFPKKYFVIVLCFGLLCGIILMLLSFFCQNRREASRIDALTEYLEKVNTGGAGLLPLAKEDAFSKLQDEIYKTVTMLYQTREEALLAKNNFAENLANIAHQLKTPITAISLSAQMMKGAFGQYLEQIIKQLSRLTHLEEALLLLSRMDAGTLIFEKKEVDVFTVLMLAADNLCGIFEQAGVFIDIPEMGECTIYADLEWTMEAVMNLLKNCMEHTPSGKTVYCSYEKNLLYTEIRIRDEGEGFAKEDLPHIFERFYRGSNAAEGGIGIGLSLAKEIIEAQRGTVRAGNLTDGGAFFEIRFYTNG